MRIIEVNKEHTKLYLSNDKGMKRVYTIITTLIHPETKKVYLCFADPKDKTELGLIKINAAAVTFNVMTNLLESFSENLTKEEWKYINNELNAYLDSLNRK